MTALSSRFPMKGAHVHLRPTRQMMLIRPKMRGAALAAILSAVGILRGAETTPYACSGTVDDAFVGGVWAKVAAQDCLKCHKDGGDAEDSDFVLSDPTKALGAAREEMM